MKDTMKAALVRAPGEAPVYADFPAPKPGAGERLIHVTTAAISPLTRSRASGAHYTATGSFPSIPGVDGVGRLDDGSRVYFVFPPPPYGAMAEQTLAPAELCVAVPDDLDDVTAAAIANPGMSSWAAFVERAKLKAGETVLVNGATGAAGRLAVQIARYFGAARVIATGRDAAALSEVATFGADVTILLGADGDALEDTFKEQFAAGVDVVLDYLWGMSAERLLTAAAKAGEDARPIRFVQIGSASAQTITLPSAALRASAIELMGSGAGSVPREQLLAAVDSVLRAAAAAGFRIATEAVALSQIETVWAENDSRRRTVIVMDGRGA